VRKDEKRLLEKSGFPMGFLINKTCICHGISMDFSLKKPVISTVWRLLLRWYQR
jgi:hypothetical protein